MKNMNVCILSHGPISNDGRVLKTLDFLNKSGFNVCVFFPESSPGESTFPEKDKNICLFPEKKRNSIFRKFLRHSLFPFELNYLSEAARRSKKQFDFIFVNDLPCLMAGRKIQKTNPGSKLIYDSHEIFNETVNQFFPTNAGFFKSLFYKGLIRFMRFFGTWIECRLVKKVDLFITVNESLKYYFEKKYRISNVRVLMNCPSKEKPNVEQEIKVDFRKEYEWAADTRVFLYQGFWNKGRGLELLIRAFRKTPEDFKLILIGGGGLEEDLINLVCQLNLEEKVKLFGFVAYNKLHFYTKAADVGINLLEPFNLSKAMASPNKLFEYIHAFIPVLCSDTAENRKVLSLFNVGVLVENTEESLLNGFNFYSSIENIIEKTKNHYLAIEKYNWESQTKVLNDFFSEGDRKL